MFRKKINQPKDHNIKSKIHDLNSYIKKNISLNNI